MQVWKRRLAVVVAASAGSAGLMMSTAGAQTSPPNSVPTFPFPTFTLPTFPPPPTRPPPTSPPPPPTMPPPTSTPPPPTMPPPTSTPPPTMPPPTVPVPNINDRIDSLLDDLENFIERGEAGYEQFQDLLADLRASFRR